MYIGLFLIILAILFAIAGVFSGGVFTIVLVPLAVIAVVAAVTTLMSARAAGITETLTQPPDPVPSGRISRDSGPPPGEVPTTPDEYVDARQKSQ